MTYCNKCNREYRNVFSVNENKKYCETCWNVLSKDEIIFELPTGGWFHKDDYPKRWQEWKEEKDKATQNKEKK